MTYTEALNKYLAENPGVSMKTPEDADAFNRWAGERGGFGENPTVLDKYPDLLALYQTAKQSNPALTPHDFVLDWANKNPTDKRLDDTTFLSEMQLEPDTTTQPAEVPIINNGVIPAINTLIAGDAARRAYADQTLATYGKSYDAMQQAAAGLQANQIDGAAYLRANPDLVADFQAAHASGAAYAADINTYAKTHWELYGKNEGRASPYVSQNLINSNAASTDAANRQLAALNGHLETLKSGLNTELAAKTSALQAQIATLGTNLSTLTADQRASLAKQISENYLALNNEVASRKQALTEAVGQMQGALTAENAARKQALETELTGLNAAQAPLNEARLAGATAMSTAINLGLESTRDNMVAQAAQQGYVGGSTGTDMAMTRATIGARQDAARAMTDARVANAADTAGIAKYGANQGRLVADQLAQGNRELAYYNAGEGRSIADYGSAGTRAIADRNAEGARTISDQDATGRFTLGNYGAEQTRTLADYGASQGRAINDYGASEKRGVLDADAQRKLQYFNDDLKTRLASLTLPAQLAGADLSFRSSLDDYATSGTRAAINMMNSISTGNGAAPTPGVTNSQAVGNPWESIGGGLASLGGSIGNASKWKFASSSPSNNGDWGGETSNPADPNKIKSATNTNNL